jgi:hypothetical protein
VRGRTLLSGLVLVGAAACLAAAFYQGSSRGFGLVAIVYVAGPIAVVSAIATFWFGLGDVFLSKDAAAAAEEAKRPPKRRRQL